MIKNIRPYKHQSDALTLSRKTNQIALFFDMGTGKTLTSIMILDDKIERLERIPKTLIIGPLSVVYNWQKEILRFTEIMREDVVLLEGSGAQKVTRFEKEIFHNGVPICNKVVIVNYDALLNANLFKLVDAWQPELLIIDESHMVKNGQAKRSKLVCQIADQAKYKLILTGTPIANTPLDAFMQYRILDGGATLGKNVHIFKKRYFRDENIARAGTRGYFPKLTPIETMYEELTAKIFSKALRVKKEDCLDLPERIEINHYADMSDDQRKAYNAMKKDFIAFVDQPHSEPRAIVAQMAMTKAMRMQQIVTGFATGEDGNIIDFGYVPRLQEVEELLSQLVTNHKVILWTCFKYNIVQLSKVCDKLKITYVKLDGDMNGKEKQEAVDAFENHEGVRCIIANRRAGGTGINLIQASYSIVYSKNQSLIEESQSRDRNYRGGSQIHRSITKIDLCCKGTIDEVIDASLRNKENLAEKILTMKGDI